MENILFQAEDEITFHEISKTSATKQRKGRTEYFSAFEKQQLVELVKERPPIWDLKEKSHSNTNYINQKWSEIGSVLGKPAVDCKRAWVALRESYRYHERTAKLKKSGSAGGDYLESPHFMETASTNFEFDLSFLGDTSQKRKTFQSVENLISDLDASSSTQYFYEDQPKSKQPKSDKILSECLDIQKRLLEEHAETKKSTLKYAEFWTYVESLVKDLPAREIFERQQNFLTNIFEKLM